MPWHQHFTSKLETGYYARLSVKLALMRVGGKGMKIHLTLIDTKGFIHFLSCDSKPKAIQSLNTLKEGTEVRWTAKNEVFVSQQYQTR